MRTSNTSSRRSSGSTLCVLIQALASACASSPATPATANPVPGTPSAQVSEPAQPEKITKGTAPSSEGLPLSESAPASGPPKALDPFTDPDSWLKLPGTGERWSMKVTMAMNNVAVKGAAVEGDYEFALRVCKDGRVDDVITKSGAASTEDQARVQAAMRGLSLPPPSAELAQFMDGECATIAHVFRWTNSGVR